MSDEPQAKRLRRKSVAYFCMEYGLRQGFSIYSGGLGILAADIVKQSRDMNLPLYGIGIFWNSGYVSQSIDKDGNTKDSYPATDRSQLIKQEGIKFSVKIEGKDMPLCVHRVKGAENLLMIEPEKKKDQKKYTDKLYQGSDEDRVAQEIILGVGGVRALRALDINTDIYHFNEGHAVFAGIELIREKMEKEGAEMTFEQAWAATKNQVIFTTHTPVPAGNEQHPFARLETVGANLNLDADQMKQIGDEPFGMTIAGLRLSYLSNGVAQLHGETAREMWKDVSGSSEIIAITNGVHCASWSDPEIISACESNNDSKLWEAHMANKRALIKEVEERTGSKLKEDVFLVGFARRAATYKRHNLIFKDESSVFPLLKEGKLQLVFSGKAHPQDEGGKEMIKKVSKYQHEFPDAVVYMPNYDIKLGALITRGSDVWLNNPQRPKEASGTSGMKAAMNGVLNLSIPDGWWPEGCKHGVNGWKVGDDVNREEEEAYEKDHAALIKVLTEEVIPAYGDKTKWINMMKASIDMAKYQFSAERMVHEYYAKMYDVQP
ncbi:unnamed protein product [Vitrella brassicaformis CCMP3155]|uniref:glycogen phosphorylase n=2 Tax=Vitrella brassicaformis TaxID=1169539 RepID=A0A0G4F0I7_VITBC|nr:unnamed protein product [Vitrella brassicaformis CCMP3155]|eukprot:CEM05243.1 unnamed protein product [Vitrella brassicaformis CCMP3155]